MDHLWLKRNSKFTKLIISESKITTNKRRVITWKKTNSWIWPMKNLPIPILVTMKLLLLNKESISSVMKAYQSLLTGDKKEVWPKLRTKNNVDLAGPLLPSPLLKLWITKLMENWRLSLNNLLWIVLKPNTPWDAMVVTSLLLLTGPNKTVLLLNLKIHILVDNPIVTNNKENSSIKVLNSLPKDLPNNWKLPLMTTLLPLQSMPTKIWCSMVAVFSMPMTAILNVWIMP